MKTTANIVFADPNHKVSSNTLHDYLQHDKAVFSALSYYDEDDKYTLVQIELAEAGLKEQLQAMARGLAITSGWEFVGPRCTHSFEVKHEPRHVFMMNVAPRFKEEAWYCVDPLCRRQHGVTLENRSNRNMMTYKEFNIMLHASVSMPEPKTPAPEPVRSTNFMAQLQAAERMAGAMADSFSEDLRKVAKEPPSLTMALIDELKAANKGLNEDLAVANKQLEEWDEAKLLPRLFVQEAEKMFMFLGRLNLQDHSIAEQRELRERMSGMKKGFEQVVEQFNTDEDYFAWLRKDS